MMCQCSNCCSDRDLQLDFTLVSMLLHKEEKVLNRQTRRTAFCQGELFNIKTHTVRHSFDVINKLGPSMHISAENIPIKPHKMKCDFKCKYVCGSVRMCFMLEGFIAVIFRNQRERSLYCWRIQR